MAGSASSFSGKQYVRPGLGLRKRSEFNEGIGVRRKDVRGCDLIKNERVRSEGGWDFRKSLWRSDAIDGDEC